MARAYEIKSETRKGTSGIDYKAELNEQQFEAVTSKPGAALVIAGAGSGKTRTLTYRVAFLLDQGVDPANILLLTFTNKASKEMLERVKQLVPVDVSSLWGGTFHSIGNRILRRSADEIGFTRSFSIMDRDDQKSLLRTVIAEVDVDTKGKRFPKADVLLSIFSLSVNTAEKIEDILTEKYPYFAEWEDDILKINEGYQQKKQDTNSMDFDDLLVQTVKLLKADENLLGLYQERFKYVLVDEYQDTNRVQSEMIDLLVGKHKSLMVVGDDAQSIYSWRGADMDHILDFPERYPQAKTYKIETNYRSVPEILELSNKAIAANKRQFVKELRSSRSGGSALPALVPVQDPRAQAEFVGQRILELRDEGVELEEMAIIYRAHHQSLEVQMELTNRNIPFQITSGLRFFEQAHVKDVAAFLRFVVNNRDEVSFKRMVLLFPGVGDKSAVKLWQSWLKASRPGDSPPPKYSEIFKAFSVPKKAQKTWDQFCYTMDELAPGGMIGRPSEMIYSILEGLYDEYLKQNFDNYENRRSDIEQLQEYAQTFDDIEEFLSQLALLSTADSEGKGGKEERETEAVTLSSIHQAKGLEYKVVFVIWLTDGMFPNMRILESEDEADLEEERRLFYVAVTRAKDELYLTYPMINPKSYSGDVMQTPSMFLDDFPREMVEEWEVNGGTMW